MKTINIPNMTEIKPEYTRDDKDFYVVSGVLDFYLDKNQLCYMLDNYGKVGKIRCLKKYGNEYKIFAYKTLGIMSQTVYFFLDMNNTKLYLYNGGSWADSSSLEEWAEYLISGGSLEKAIKYNEENKSSFDPFKGI